MCPEPFDKLRTALVEGHELHASTGSARVASADGEPSALERAPAAGPGGVRLGLVGIMKIGEVTEIIVIPTV
jgi:hypothetical protein